MRQQLKHSSRLLEAPLVSGIRAERYGSIVVPSHIVMICQASGMSGISGKWQSSSSSSNTAKPSVSASSFEVRLRSGGVYSDDVV